MPTASAWSWLGTSLSSWRVESAATRSWSWSRTKSEKTPPLLMVLLLASGKGMSEMSSQEGLDPPPLPSSATAMRKQETL